MKKYVKPEIHFELFNVEQQIAACDYDSNNSMDDTGCRYTGINKDFGVEMTILQSNCDVFVEDYCYHSSSGEHYNLFNS